MKTPAGKECQYYYQDFHRGRSKQECRLLAGGSGAQRWHPEDCKNCPVPDILWANSSERLQLHATVRAGILGIGRSIEVVAWCSEHQVVIPDPYSGCEFCSAAPPDIAAYLE
jgi:hypothetical protein